MGGLRAFMSEAPLYRPGAHVRPFQDRQARLETVGPASAKAPAVKWTVKEYLAHQKPRTFRTIH